MRSSLGTPRRSSNWRLPCPIQLLLHCGRRSIPTSSRLSSASMLWRRRPHPGWGRWSPPPRRSISWRPYMEASVDDLKYTMNLVRQDLAKQRAPPPPSPTPLFVHAVGVLGSYQSARGCPPPTTGKVDGPMGHRVEHQRRESGFRRVYAQTHIPHNGTPKFLFHPHFSI
jgi:hypothetical protein